MSRQIIKQPNGLYAQWSSIVDDFVMIDATKDDIIADWLADSLNEITEHVNRIITQLDKGEKPYYQFTMTFDEAVRFVIKRYGRDSESINMITEAGIKIS